MSLTEGRFGKPARTQLSRLRLNESLCQVPSGHFRRELMRITKYRGRYSTCVDRRLCQWSRLGWSYAAMWFIGIVRSEGFRRLYRFGRIVGYFCKDRSKKSVADRHRFKVVHCLDQLHTRRLDWEQLTQLGRHPLSPSTTGDTDAVDRKGESGTETARSSSEKQAHSASRTSRVLAASGSRRVPE
jgi:hypothetical protein